MPTHPPKKITWEQAALWFGIVAAIAAVTGLTLGDFVDKKMMVKYLQENGVLIAFGLVGLVLLGSFLRGRFFPGDKTRSIDLPPGAPDPDLVAKVRHYLNERYTHRLNQKLAGRQPVNLRILPSKTGTSQEGAENYMNLQEEEVRAAIGDIFTRANGRLLLVGLPGAGKTTLVLQLALHLLERPGSSMPVVLNLATWRAEFKTFEEWLKKILPTELGASTGLAEQIRKHTPLILLLDGLDEVPEADRDSLLAGIGEYGADANRQFLISSRIAEYAATKDAPVNAQVEVAPLTVEQVEIGLAATAGLQPESKRLLNALKSDPLLRSAVENPFYLNTAQLLFSTGKNWSELEFVATDLEGRQRELVERFVGSTLGQKILCDYPPSKARHWLSFLSSRMTGLNIMGFKLKDLQYDWWRWNKWQIGLGGFVLGLVYLLILALIGEVIGEIGCGLILGQFIPGVGPGADKRGWLLLLFLPLFIGLYCGLSSSYPPIDTKENIRWTWKNLMLSFRKNQSIGLFVGLAFGLFGWLFGWLALGMMVGSVIGIAYIVFGGLFDTMQNSTDIIQIITPYQSFTASMKALHFSVLQHWTLRYQLSRQGLLPPDFVQFLNEMSLRHILEFDGDPRTGKGGGAWRFRHRILQEWFAERWVEPEWPDKKRTNQINKRPADVK